MSPQIIQSPLEKNEAKIALITGASSGIGEAIAHKLAAMKMHVILVARRLERLQATAADIQSAGGSAEFIVADLLAEEERTRATKQVLSRHGKVDIVVNNAGFGWYGFGHEMPWSIARDMIGINIAALVHLTLFFLERMKERGEGHIINIGSISGELPSQGIAVYGATKAFLNNFTTALHRELRGSGVKVSVVRAGPVKTEFCQQAGDLPNGFHLPTERKGITPELVAEKIWELIRRPRRVIYIPTILALTPWIEASFGWLIDRLGPLLLQKAIKSKHA